MRLLNKAFMHKHKLYLSLMLLMLLISVSLLYAQPDTQQLYSPQIALQFHKIVYELYNSGDFDISDAEHSRVFLTAAMNLDDKADYLLTDMLNVGLTVTGEDDKNLFFQVLGKYLANPDLDLALAKQAVRHLAAQMDSRQQREDMLSMLLRATSRENSMLASEIATELGLLAAEKTDFDNARYYLTYAYGANPYNRLAFAKLDEIARQSGEQIQPVIYARHLRMAMAAAPLDSSSVFTFAKFVEQLSMYELAADAYEYSAELFEYNFEGIDLPASIYLPWALANYNTVRDQENCLKIARRIRKTGQLDIVLEAIAAAAAKKMGDFKKSMEILQVGKKAETMIMADSPSSTVDAEKLAWFYCFALPNPEKALAWANKAYTRNPKSSFARALFAYSLVINNQAEIAQEYLADLYQKNQIAALAMAIVQIEQNKKEQALETLKASIAVDPGSLVAEHAKKMLAENDSEYIPQVSPDLIRQSLEDSFGKKVVPEFKKPSQLISAKLNLSGSEFSYGSTFDAKIIITNNSSQPLVIFDQGLFTGNIRVDAYITGDITTTITNLISKKIQPPNVIEPGQHVSIPLDLITGPLRQLLFTYPQAEVEIEFTVYMDPVTDDQGTITNMLRDIRPVKTRIKRTGLALSRKYLMQRMAALAGGREGQKVQAAKLFVGLLAESYALEKTGPLYRHMQVDRLILTDAVRRALVDDNWKVKVHTVSALLMLNSLDYTLIEALADNINDDYWPVRLSALYALSRTRHEDFQEVLNWKAKNDTHQLVRNMAVVLGGIPPETSDNSSLESPKLSPEKKLLPAEE
jgi:tetratricopeptide (TPR) repeat protein